MIASSKGTEPGSNTHADSFDWPLAFTAEQYLRQQIDRFLAQNQVARDLAQRMQQQTATDFFEWVDHLVLDAREEEAGARYGSRDPR